MSDVLDVHLYGHQIGELRRRGVEDYVLEYDNEWASADETIPLSLSLPLSRRQHRGKAVVNFVDNLLPDNPEVRQRWATDAGLDSVEPFFLLREYGEDVAGAASFMRKGSSGTSARRSMTDDEIAERIRLLREDETAWHDDALPATGQFSLGGAQTKFSLARHGEGWFEASGADASTHLFKPQVKGARDGELVEYLIMKTAYFLGIPAASVDLFEHADQHSLVVERFDRRREGDRVVRLHQEDLLQSLGRPRLLKFETHGGPGLHEITALLERTADDESRKRYAAMLFFSWLVLSTDAHAKNYSLFIQPNGATLTPLYDASSVIPYLGDSLTLDEESIVERAGNAKLAIKFGASYRARDVGRFELEMVARRCGLASDDLLAIVALQLIEVCDVISDVADQIPSGLQTDTIARAVEWMPARVRQAAASLNLSGLL